jgi:hypothetical protein
MRRQELVARTRQLVDEGERLDRDPSLGALQIWLQHSDDLLATAWGSMDRYHLAWLTVGKSAGIVRGRPLTADEESAYVRDVARQKTAVLRTSLDAATRGMPFVGEDAGSVGDSSDDEVDGETGRRQRPGPPPRRGPSDPELARRLAEAREQAELHRGHEPRAPRPPKMQR